MSSRALDLGLAANSFVTVLPDLSSLPNVGDVLSVKTVSGGMVATGFNAPSGMGAFLPLTGGVLTGPLTLAADPTAPLGAATMQWVSTKVGAYLPLAGGTVIGPTTFNANRAYTPSNQTNSLFFANSAVSGTINSSTYNYAPFQWQIPSNSIDASASNGFWGAKFIHNFGGTKGGQGALDVVMTQTSAVLDAASFFVTGINSYLDIEYAGNGVGNAIAFSPLVYYGAGASGWAAWPIEAGIIRAAGSTALKTAVLNLTWTNNATTHASQWETVINFAGVPGNTTRLNSLFSIGNTANEWPLDTAAGIIFTTGPQTNNNPGNTQRITQACAGGFDFRAINFSSYALWSPGVRIRGTSEIDVGPLQIMANATGAQLDATGTIGAIASVSAGGAGYQINDQLYDGLGGIIQVTAVSSGVVTAASYIAGKEPYFFGTGPATVTPTGGSGTSPATFNVTWTARNALSLSPSGGSVMINAGGTITSGSAAPAATQPAGSIYMRTGGASGARLYVSAGAGTWTAVSGV